MVKIKTEKGGYVYEPPYTEAEEAELYRRMASGPVTIYRGQRVPPQTPPKSQDPQEGQ